VVADESARADWVAADLVAQAEHGPGSQIFLLTPSFLFLGKVLAEVLSQSGGKPRAKYLREVLAQGATLVRTKDVKQAVELAEAIAPEHLSLQCRGAKALAKKIRCAGAVFDEERGDEVGGGNRGLGKQAANAEGTAKTATSDWKGKPGVQGGEIIPVIFGGQKVGNVREYEREGKRAKEMKGVYVFEVPVIFRGWRKSGFLTRRRER